MSNTRRIQTKFLSLLFVIVIGGTALLGAVAVQSMNETVLHAGQDKLRSDLATAGAYVELRYDGSWSVAQNALYKGAIPIKGNTSLVDDVQRLTGDAVTIFLQDRAVSTTIAGAMGQTGPSIQVAKAIADQVLNKGQLYLGKVNIGGNQYEAAYQPIRDPNGHIIGIWSVATPMATYVHLEQTLLVRLGAFGLGGLVITFLVAWILTRRIVKPIQQLKTMMERVAEGDFSVDELVVRSRDEVGALVVAANRMTEHAREMMREIGAASAKVSATAEGLSAISAEMTVYGTQMEKTMREVATGAEQQGVVAVTSANAVATMTDGLEEIARVSGSAAVVAETSMTGAQLGQTSLEQAGEQMSRIGASVEQSANQITRMREQSTMVQSILTTIQAIAEQTNLLALNASIEAARAGEHGRGFAVVANEVRTLSAECAQAAQGIEDIVQTLQQEIHKSVQSMKVVEQEVHSGSRQVAEVATALRHIVESSGEVSGKVREIAAGTQRVAETAQHVSGQVANIAGIAQSSASTSVDMADSAERQLAIMRSVSEQAEHLREMASAMQSLVERFEL